MRKIINKYRVEANRAQYWDYSAPGKYFLTINIQDRKCILGDVKNGQMKLSPTGEIVKSEIEKIPTYYPRIILDEWIIMPNHIHLLIELVEYEYNNEMARMNDTGRIYTDNPTDDGRLDDVDHTRTNDLVKKIHEFSLQPLSSGVSTPSDPSTSQRAPTTAPPWWHNPHHVPTENDLKQYRKSRRKMIIPKIMGKMKMITSKEINLLHNTPGHKNWQSSYHDHVIRDEQAYINIKNYIINNPKNWDEDKFYRR